MRIYDFEKRTLIARLLEYDREKDIELARDIASGRHISLAVIFAGGERLMLTPNGAKWNLADDWRPIPPEPGKENQ